MFLKVLPPGRDKRQRRAATNELHVEVEQEAQLLTDIKQTKILVFRPDSNGLTHRPSNHPGRRGGGGGGVVVVAEERVVKATIARDSTRSPVGGDRHVGLPGLRHHEKAAGQSSQLQYSTDGCDFATGIAPLFAN